MILLSFNYALTNNPCQKIVKILSYFDPALKTVVKDLGFKHNMSNEKAKKQLNWNQRSEEKTILDTTQSLIKQGAIKL